MNVKLLIFDSHPVQYRVPIWRNMERIKAGYIHVVYASDCSVKGYADAGFGKTFSWDDPLLEGYDYTILNCENGKPLSGWGSLTGKGVKQIIDKFKPEAILLTGLNYKYDIVALLIAISKKIPLWLRCETQDEANIKPAPVKALTRYLAYSTIYKAFNRFFYIGELNKQHYLKHGVSHSRLTAAHYSTVDRYDGWTDKQKSDGRVSSRNSVLINDDAYVIGFSGKFIFKKNPEILFEMLEYLSVSLRSRTILYFMGSGELENLLVSMAQKALLQFGVRSIFTGFVNQSKIGLHYLAMDTMVLPSRRMGETWGLVANEAMQAGCSVVVSNAVGCSADFSTLERFKVFEEGNAAALAGKIEILAQAGRDFNWAKEGLSTYTIEAAADALVNNL